jgi:hypothetical protein
MEKMSEVLMEVDNIVRVLAEDSRIRRTIGGRKARLEIWADRLMWGGIALILSIVGTTSICLLRFDVEISKQFWS